MMKLPTMLAMSAAVLTLSLTVPLSSRAQSSANASQQTTAQQPAAQQNTATQQASDTNDPNVQGCGNSGKPGCPPKKCPPGHGGTNPAGNPDCKKQTSGD